MPWFIEYLQQCLDNAKIGQRSLAKIIPISQPTISRILNEKHILTPKQFYTIFEILKKLQRCPKNSLPNLEKIYYEKLSSSIWNKLLNNEVSFLRSIFGYHDIRKLIRKHFDIASYTELNTITSVIEKRIKTRHTLRYLNKPSTWQLVNELFALLRHTSLTQHIDLDLVRKVFHITQHLNDGHRLIFPATATLAYHGDSETTSKLSKLISSQINYERELLENVTLYYGSKTKALQSLLAMTSLNPSLYSSEYLKIMKVATDNLSGQQ